MPNTHYSNTSGTKVTVIWVFGKRFWLLQENEYYCVQWKDSENVLCLETDHKRSHLTTWLLIRSCCSCLLCA